MGAGSEDMVLLHEPGRYPIAYFPLGDVQQGLLVPEERRTHHRALGDTAWFTIQAAGKVVAHAAWEHIALPDYATILKDRVAFAWRAIDAFYEEDERIFGHAADAYHRIDIRRSSRHLQVKLGDHILADTRRPLVLFESGFAPRWHVPREDVDALKLTTNPLQVFCPYKGIASYYDADDHEKMAWSYTQAWREVVRISNFIPFEPHVIDVLLDGRQLRLEPDQNVVPHGPDRGLDVNELVERGLKRDA
jgi:uncharacterized protein (DUF427 family)